MTPILRNRKLIQRSPLHHWMRLNGWAPAAMAAYLEVTRFTVHRLETYRRRPGPETLERIAALPNFPLTAEELRADFDAHYTREPLRRSA